MPIRVRSALRDRLRGERTVLFVVRGEETAALADGTRAACAAVAGMDAGWESAPGLEPGDANNPAYVSAPIPVPGGRLVMVDFGHVPPPVRAELPEVVSGALTAAGVTDASIEPAPRMGDRYRTLDRFLPVTRAWLRAADPPDRPRALTRPPAALMAAGREWLRGEHADGDELLALAVSVEVPLTADAFTPIVDHLLTAHAPMPTRTPVLTTDFRTHAAVAEFGTLFGFGLLLTAGGAGWSPSDLAARMRRQRDLIRAYAADLSWAVVAVDRADRNLLIPQTRFDGRGAPIPTWYRLHPPGGGEEETSGEPEDHV